VTRRPLHPVIAATLRVAGESRRLDFDITQEAKVASNTFANWRDGRGATLTTVSKILGALGYRLVVERIEQETTP
jgi:hypothetical protein